MKFVISQSLPVRVGISGLLALCLVTLCNGDLVDVTNTFMNGINAGIVSAFGDYTADKATDIFMLTEDKKDIDLIMNLKNGFQRLNLVKSAKDDGDITSIMPGDFNGDTYMDILVTRKISSQNYLTVQIYWTEQIGETRHYKVKNSTKLPDKFSDQPLLMDYDGDMIPDLYAQSLDDNKRYYWVFDTTGTFTKIEQTLPSEISSYKIRSPHSNAFIDLSLDLTADLFVTSVDANGESNFEIWMSEYDGLQYNRSFGKPRNSGKVIGQSTFMDLDGDSEMDMLLPVCGDASCKESSIYAYVRNKWYLLIDSFVDHGEEWGFAPPGTENNIPVTLRVGDYDLDGFPDILAVMKSTKAGKNSQRAFLLLNVPCTVSRCENVGRTFQVEFKTPLQDVGDVTSAAFFDLNGNGVVDVLVQHYDAGVPKLLAFQNGFNEDACFMKVMVISGRCDNTCPGGRPAYATNQPGISIYYDTTGADGGKQASLAGQLSQSAHYALQLPYVVFGLGLTPNFVDGLRVGIPRGVNQDPKNRVWTSIIPNSQLVIIPHPPQDPRSWRNKLFVSPFTNKQVIYTAGALLGTCVFVAGIVGALQWRERAEDKREKLQESQKFHFDAM